MLLGFLDLDSLMVPALIIPELAESDYNEKSDDAVKFSRQTLLKQTSVDSVEHSGFFAAFLARDALYLGMNISDLVHRQGSQAAKVLRGKAAVLESALQNTLGMYSVKIPE